MTRVLALVFALFAAAGCQTWTDVFVGREELKLYRANAQRNYHAGQYERAVHQARKALEIDEEDVKSLTILGYCYFQVARYAKTRELRLEYYARSEAELEKAILAGSETDPAIFKAYFGLGLVYFSWAQEVKSMIEESEGKREPLVLAESDDGSSSDLWSR